LGCGLLKKDAWLVTDHQTMRPTAKKKMQKVG